MISDSAQKEAHLAQSLCAVVNLLTVSGSVSPCSAALFSNCEGRSHTTGAVGRLGRCTLIGSGVYNGTSVCRWICVFTKAFSTECVSEKINALTVSLEISLDTSDSSSLGGPLSVSQKISEQAESNYRSIGSEPDSATMLRGGTEHVALHSLTFRIAESKPFSATMLRAGTEHVELETVTRRFVGSTPFSATMLRIGEARAVILASTLTLVVNVSRFVSRGVGGPFSNPHQ